MRKKLDKIDGLFRDYFAGKPDDKLMVREDSSAIYACEYMECCESDSPIQAKSKCPDAAKLGAHIDGSLSKSEAALLEKHLSGCKKCLEKVRQAKIVIEQFEKGSLPEASEPVSPEELSRLTKRSPRKK